MMRILLFARDPGGSNTVIPLAVALNRHRYTPLLYGKDSALVKYRQAGLEGADIVPALHGDISLDSVRRFLQQVRPLGIITGTSADDMTEKYLWKAAEELGIPSIAILDQWLNYGIRFSQYGISEIEKYSVEQRHPFLPTRITAPDEFALAEMKAAGLPVERLIVTGQPYFESVLAHRASAESLKALNLSLGLSEDDFVVVFASEPMTTTIGDAALNYWGYNELTILSALAAALDEVFRVPGRKVKLIVRPHPKEGNDHFSSILGSLRHVHARVDSTSSPWMLMGRADLVCGMSSMFLIEAAVLRRPVLSIQIGLRRENPFILDRRRIAKSVVTDVELRAFLASCLAGKGHAIPAFDIIRNPTERILSEMEKLLCPS